MIALTNIDEVGIVLGLLDAKLKEFLQQDSHLDAIGRGKRIELQIVFADRQFFIVRRAGDRSVDVCKTPPTFFVPLPDFRWCICIVFCHVLLLFFGMVFQSMRNRAGQRASVGDQL